MKKNNTSAFSTICKVYTRRWYILTVFSLFAFTQSCFWNTWGPISTSSEVAFGWTDSTVAWLTNWGPISYVITGLTFPWILQVKGLRWATVPSMLLVAIGSCFRVITSETTAATILIHIGQFLNGLAGPMAMGGIATLSAIWFPPKERFTATAIGVNLCSLGASIAFISGPALVSVEPYQNQTALLAENNTIGTPKLVNQTSRKSSNITEDRIIEGKKQIMSYMYYECGWCCLILLLTLIYFPSRPPRPPSASATTDRENYWKGIWSLRKKTDYILLAVSYGISTGVINCWASLLNVNLRPFHISETEAGWIGFYASVPGYFFSLIIGRFADLFARRSKQCILILLALSSACFILFTLMLIDSLAFTRALLYTSTIGGVTCLNCAVPLLYELGCELAFPTSEGAANGVLTLLNNIGGIIFLAVFSFPDVGSMWMNWVAIGSVTVSIPLIALVKGRFQRLEVDETIHKVTEQQVDVVEENKTIQNKQ
ncbi:solute carrier family 49 member 4-like isoform X3 [Biomphalaria glabrata]|uniref:Solute carrier family 49 member 4-like isoform X3 n=1 Tax=Biomphalaria glabrata TaxID=6526 RepID=A0A9W2YBH5_BIOGL|nr:solute carrier family 49 member 4-like isoform X3 [Biomphalaria glabrata]